MRKKIALIGLVIFIVGIVMLAVGALEVQGALHQGTAYTQYSTGKYVSSEINLTSNATLTLTSAPSNMGVVSAADMPTVTNSTLSSVELKPLTTALGSESFLLPSGSYYVVYFGNSAPSTHYTYLYVHTITPFALLTSSGLFIAIAGGIVGIVGVVLKQKKQQPA